MKKIKVSILVPIYNVERYLDECLSSLARQTIKDIEIICINDGSTDSSLEIIKKYAKVDKRFKILNKENSGYGDSMNRGLKTAKGEYIGIVESDDFVKKEMFEDLYKIAKENDADVVKSNAFFYWTDTNKVSPMDIIDEKNVDKLVNTRKHPEVVYKIPSIWSAIYRKEFLTENRINFLPTPGASYQDTSFTYKVWFSAERVYFTPKRYLYYRQDNANSSMNNVAKKAPTIFKEFEEIEKFIDKKCPECQQIIWERKYIHSYNFLPQITGLAMLPYIKKMSQEFKKHKIQKKYFQNKKQEKKYKIIKNMPYYYFVQECIMRKSRAFKNIVKNLFFQSKKRNELIQELKVEISSRKKYPGPEHFFFFEPTITEKISIIVPTYNDGETIEKCLDMLINQTYKNIEIIIVNDGNDKDSDKIIEKYLHKDKRIKTIKTGHRGVASARNIGLQISTGDYVMWCDSDDYFEKNTCERMLYALKKVNADYAECETNLLIMNNLQSGLKQGVDKYLLLKYIGKQTVNQNVMTTTDASLWNKIYRKEIIDRCNIDFPDGLYFEDAYFNDVYMLNSKTGIYLKDEKLYNYIRKNDSIMSQAFNRTGISKDYRKIVVKLYNYMKTNNLLEDNKNFFWIKFVQYSSFSLEYLKKKERKTERKEIRKFIKSHSSDLVGIERYLKKEVIMLSRSYFSIFHNAYCAKRLLLKKINSKNIEKQQKEIDRLQSNLRECY